MIWSQLVVLINKWVLQPQTYIVHVPTNYLCLSYLFLLHRCLVIYKHQKSWWRTVLLRYKFEVWVSFHWRGRWAAAEYFYCQNSSVLYLPPVARFRVKGHTFSPTLAKCARTAPPLPFCACAYRLLLHVNEVKVDNCWSSKFLCVCVCRTRSARWGSRGYTCMLDLLSKW